MKNYNVLIAGGSGNVGRYLASSLKRRMSITIIGNNSSSSEPNYFNIDLTKKEQIDRFIAKNNKFDILIFLVGLAHKKGKKNDYHEFYRINYITLENIYSSFEKEKKIPDKIIFSSTISIYGERFDLSNYKENLTPKPRSPYAKTKLEAEQFIRDQAKAKYWILRFAPVYSNSFRLNIEKRTKILSKNYKVGLGDAKLSLCNIKNIILTVDNIINENIIPGIYNISDNLDYSYNDLLKYQNSKNILIIPKFFILWSYYFGLLINNNFLIENSLKLFKDNIFCSNKLSSQVHLSYTLFD